MSRLGFETLLSEYNVSISNLEAEDVLQDIQKLK
ncbi:MAG: hypothetical protein AAF960_05690 [Bacteroidota bacterium]